MTAGGGDGLELKKGETLTQGSLLRNAAEDLDEVKKSLGGDAAAGLTSVLNIFGPEKFGEYGATAAFSAFADAWNLECSTLAGALREIHGKIGDGVKLNDGTDHGVRSGLESIGGSGGSGFGSLAPNLKESPAHSAPAQGGSLPR